MIYRESDILDNRLFTFRCQYTYYIDGVRGIGNANPEMINEGRLNRSDEQLRTSIRISVGKKGFTQYHHKNKGEVMCVRPPAEV